MRRSKLRNKRPKALFGEVAAAGIQAAATLAAAGIQARQMASSAKEQANAQIQGAQMQAKSIEQTNQNNNTLQQQSQQFIASENEANRQLQRDWQMNMQLAQGMLTSEDRRAESRIQVKKGGKVRRSNKGLRDASFPLRAGNLPFQVTDGGGVIPVGTTPEGYDLYEIVGNDHDHYHKTKGGKRKSGVGIKFGNGQIVEGEGNQNSSQGEYLLTTPDAGFFISKHSVNGFNPAEAVNAGMSPIAAYQLQEANKNGNSPVGRRYAKGGLYVQPVLATGYPVQDLNFDMVGPNTAYLMQRPSLKRGGRVKAVNGNIVGGWITGGGNILGGVLGGLGNYWAGRIGARASMEALPYLTNAYRNLKTIDLSSIKRDSFTGANVMPVVQSVHQGINNRLENINRGAGRSIKANNAGTLSSAARQSRMNTINTAAAEQRSQAYEDQANRQNQLALENTKMINEAGMKNAELNSQWNRDYMTNMLGMMQYNNDIVNSGIMGEAEARANAIIGAAQSRAVGTQGLWSNIGSGLAAGAGAVGAGYSAASREQKELESVLWGSDLDNRVSYLAQIDNPALRQRTLNELNIRYKNTIDPDNKAKIGMYINMLGGTIPGQEVTSTSTPRRLGLRDYVRPMLNVFGYGV